MRRIYVYSLHGSLDQLWRDVESYLGTAVWHWVADPARLEVGQGLPKGWRDQGAVFNARGEFRWWRRNDSYDALLVAEEPVEGPAPVPGAWQGKTQHIFLQDLSEPRVKPNFTAYPGGMRTGKVEACVCYRDGMPVLVSLRKFPEPLTGAAERETTDGPSAIEAS